MSYFNWADGSIPSFMTWPDHGVVMNSDTGQWTADYTDTPRGVICEFGKCAALLLAIFISYCVGYWKFLIM